MPILPVIVVLLISGCNSIYQKNISGEYSNVSARSASLLQLSENKGGRINGRLTIIQFNTSGTANKSIFYATGYDEDNKITITFTQNNPEESSVTLSGTMKGNGMFLNGINNNDVISNVDLTKNNIAAYQAGVKAIFAKEEKIKVVNYIAATDKKQIRRLTEIERDANKATKYEQNTITVFINVRSPTNIDRAKAVYAAMLNRSNQLYALEKRYSEIKTYQSQDKVYQLNDYILSLSDHLDSVNMNRNNRDKKFYNLENAAKNIYAKTGCLTLVNLLNNADTGPQYSATKNACMNAYTVYQKIPPLESSVNKVLSQVLAYQDNISSKIKETAAKANAIASQ